MIEKQLNKMSERDVLQKRVGILMKEIERKEKAFLRGDKPPVAAAALQKLLKETAAPLNIEVKLERALNPVDTEFYLGLQISVGIGQGPLVITYCLAIFLSLRQYIPYSK